MLIIYQIILAAQALFYQSRNLLFKLFFWVDFPNMFSAYGERVSHEVLAVFPDGIDSDDMPRQAPVALFGELAVLFLHESI